MKSRRIKREIRQQRTTAMTAMLLIFSANLMGSIPSFTVSKVLKGITNLLLLWRRQPKRMISKVIHRRKDNFNCQVSSSSSSSCSYHFLIKKEKLNLNSHHVPRILHRFHRQVWAKRMKMMIRRIPKQQNNHKNNNKTNTLKYPHYLLQPSNSVILAAVAEVKQLQLISWIVDRRIKCRVHNSDHLLVHEAEHKLGSLELLLLQPKSTCNLS